MILYTVLRPEEGAEAQTVPMVMIHPLVTGGSMVAEATEHLDLLPTLIDLGRAEEAGRDLIKKSLPGKSLMNKVKLEETEP